ncbi:protein translocase subunit SecF [Candidatus Gracilibacteria bacterium]|nr:protein translocase subunit SecF [Candidatus Gracilibacteria bacterium]MCF7898479.1 protein translocase subunit SecF [Candidatus Paceibacterota bacterium]
MFIIKYKAFFIGLSVALVLVSFGLMSSYGIKKGIDFTGGSVVDIAYTNPGAEINPVILKEQEIETYKTGELTYRFISSKTYEEINPIITSAANPNNATPFEFTQVNTVGPTLGAEMTKKAIIALIVVVLAILSFIAFTFREVSLPVQSWKYGVIAMVTLLHDIIVPTGVYVVLSHKYGAEVDTFFIIALLTIIGISISDKIVVFDRIRENLKLSSKTNTFDEIVGMSLMQTFTRSINTSITVILALFALFFFGPLMTKWFTLTLIIGMFVGTYSSIFVASPLLTVWNKGK